MKSLKAFFLLLALCFTLASCGGNTTTPPPVEPPTNPPTTPPADPGPVTPAPPETPPEPVGPTLSGTVENWIGQPAMLAALGYNNSEDLDALITEAPIDAGGTFSLTLPATLDPQHDAIGLFHSHDCPRGTGSYEVSPNPVQFAWIFDLRVRQGDDEPGALYRVIDKTIRSEVYAFKVYVVADSTIKGSCANEVDLEDGSTVTNTVTTDITFKAGWNDVIYTITFNDDGSIAEEDTVGEVAPEAVWLYFPDETVASAAVPKRLRPLSFGSFRNRHIGDFD